ncbi:hypothetical protein EB796_023438 [Bugula neritina]|uniref:SAM domain-containing protein n=1 Tax=Bugula neritina TaxID=10212 RepID=A0A7J7IXL7_BUGNE|nr:hypothetical protein EB796_023438 [Bugula neritina]
MLLVLGATELVRNKYRLPPPIPEAHSHKDDDDVTLEGYLNPHPPPLPKPPNSHSQKVSSSELPSPSASPGATLSTPSGHQLKCSSWTSQQVADWLDSSNLSQFKDSLSSYLCYHTLIGFYSFKEVDGEMLAELVLLSRDHKDMFYSLLNKTSATHIADFLRFSCAAKKLYMQQ